MIGWVLGLGTWKAKVGVLAALALAFWGWLEVDRYQQRSAGRVAVIEDSKKEGAKANERSQAQHSSAQRPGASDRLRKDSCRDC